MSSIAHTSTTRLVISDLALASQCYNKPFAALRCLGLGEFVGNPLGIQGNHPLCAILLSLCTALTADEGMWTFHHLPLAHLKRAYQFEPTAAWLDHLRLSTLHLGGATGSFVSSDGLVLTNQHCVRRELTRLSQEKHNLVRDGFVARCPQEEIPLPHVQYKVLMHMENITPALRLAGKKKGIDRQEIIEELQSELEEKNDYIYHLVTLYEGAETWLYGYKTFSDVRLVMTPEIGIALFGGDADNFTYPRHNLDFALLRVYEKGQPYHPPHHLKAALKGVQAGELTFVIGHPGQTKRHYTCLQLKHEREESLPSQLQQTKQLYATLQAYAQRDDDAARQVESQKLALSNHVKATEGFLTALEDTAAMQRLAQTERAFQQRLLQYPRLNGEVEKSWQQLEKVIKQQKTYTREAHYLGDCQSPTLKKAIDLVRWMRQAVLPPSERLPEFAAASDLEDKRRELEKLDTPQANMPAPLEKQMLERGLEAAWHALGPRHPYVQAALGHQPPGIVARMALEHTQVKDAAFRRRLLQGGLHALRVCRDPMVVMAKGVESVLALRAKKQAAADAVMDIHAKRIAHARFALYGHTVSPEANSTLRLSYGRVESYPANGTRIQPFTTFSGLWDRHMGWGGNASGENAWHLPQRWVEKWPSLNPSTPFNFVHSVDVMGGNSGSPVVNRQGELVGVLFDCNIQALAGRYYYDPLVNRGVSLDIRAILEALEKVYPAKHLLEEMVSGK